MWHVVNVISSNAYKFCMALQARHRAKFETESNSL